MIILPFVTVKMFAVRSTGPTPSISLGVPKLGKIHICDRNMMQILRIKIPSEVDRQSFPHYPRMGSNN